MYQHIPNALSYSRVIVAIPLFFLLLFAAESPLGHGVALAFMGYIILSDWLDGRLARRWRVDSDWGKHLDPLTDKFAELLVYGALMWRYGWWLLVTLMVVITIRHTLITLLRRWAAQAHRAIAARWSGKIRTGVSFFLALVFIAFLPYRSGQPAWVIWALEATIALLLFLTIFSLIDYVFTHRALLYRVK